MPLPMVHLSVAVSYAEKQGISDPLGTFFLGNLAPDSIHMREGITKEDKPKTHFFPNEEGDYLSKLKRFYYPLMNQSEECDWNWFVRGYFMHLITDDLWFRELYPAFVEKYTKLGRTNEEIRMLYYRETDQADFHLYNHQAWRTEVWELLKGVRSYDFIDLLTSNEILLWRDRTFSFFQDPLKEPKINPHFFTDEIVSTFVDTAADRLGDIFKEWDK
ncbi:hypothetical protein MJ257_08500 [Paenibacillus timonensis]|uniref:Phospholipase C/D domain-containing protein n=1 Tax=Paenibacillus timonensis TaxID=225915 RepID=A0ABW3SAI9_9BACL|nr:hypothetical protein [Paenibacillus timonensis]MCH1640144.1 hypothetical protein [Paenibacillus timonensis]